MNRKIWVFQLFFVMIFLTGLASHSWAAMQLTSPNGGETWYKGRTYTITWTDSRDDRIIDIELKKGTNPWITIARRISSTPGSHSWLIPSDIEAGTDYRVRIIQSDNTDHKDKSDNDFNIAEAAASEPTTPTPLTPQSLSPNKPPDKNIVDRNRERIVTEAAKKIYTCTGNEANQPDLTGAPRWSSSSAHFGDTMKLYVPVDAETGFVSVVVNDTRNENSIFAGSGANYSITPGRTQTVEVLVKINPSVRGKYFPIITLCRSSEACISSETGLRIIYGGPRETNVMSGTNYNRVCKEGSKSLTSKMSSYGIPILGVTE